MESEQNTFPNNHWLRLRIMDSYQIANQIYGQSSTFLNLRPTEQIVVQATARRTQFRGRLQPGVQHRPPVARNPAEGAEPFN